VRGLGRLIRVLLCLNLDGDQVSLYCLLVHPLSVKDFSEHYLSIAIPHIYAECTSRILQGIIDALVLSIQYVGELTEYFLELCFKARVVHLGKDSLCFFHVVNTLLYTYT
jgi:hypothetical protein